MEDRRSNNVVNVRRDGKSNGNDIYKVFTTPRIPFALSRPAVQTDLRMASVDKQMQSLQRSIGPCILIKVRA